MTRPRTFRQADLGRALREFRRQGLPIAGAEITADGVIRILTSAAPVRELTPYEKWQAENNGDRAA
jgi:hypothetical protein